MLAIALASVAVGLLALRLLGAPRALFTLVAAMVVGVAVALAITSFWKISIHVASAAGTVACLAILVSPWWLVLTSGRPHRVGQVLIRDHTPSQASAGAVVGAAVAASVSLL